MIDAIEYIIEVREYGVTDEARKRYSITFLPMSEYSVGIGIAEFFINKLARIRVAVTIAVTVAAKNFLILFQT